MVIFAFKEDCFIICPKEKLSGHAQSRVYSFEVFFSFVENQVCSGIKVCTTLPNIVIRFLIKQI